VSTKFQLIGTKRPNLSVMIESVAPRPPSADRGMETRLHTRGGRSAAPAAPLRELLRSVRANVSERSAAFPENRSGEMSPSSGIRPVYDPATLRIMIDAFDHACNFLPTQFRDSDSVRRKLALHIIRDLNDGESDSTRLADTAVLSVLGHVSRRGMGTGSRPNDQEKPPANNRAGR
jgi:hypothetical protein